MANNLFVNHHYKSYCIYSNTKLNVKLLKNSVSNIVYLFHDIFDYYQIIFIFPFFRKLDTYMVNRFLIIKLSFS